MNNVKYLIFFYLGFITIACNKKIDLENLVLNGNIAHEYTLKVNRLSGQGSFSASWEGGSATEEELSQGVKIGKGTLVTIYAQGEGDISTLSGTPEFVWNNIVDEFSNQPYTLILDNNYSISIDFRIIFLKLSLINKDANAPITAFYDSLYSQPLSSQNLEQIRPNTKIFLSINPTSGHSCTGLVGIDANSAKAGNTKASVTLLYKDTTVQSFSTFLTMSIDPGNGSVTAWTDNNHTLPATLSALLPGSILYLVITPPVGKKFDKISYATMTSIQENSDASVFCSILVDADGLPVVISYKDKPIVKYKVTINTPTNVKNTISVYLDRNFTIPFTQDSVLPNTILYFKLHAGGNDQEVNPDVISANGSTVDNNNKVINNTYKDAQQQITITDNTIITPQFNTVFSFSNSAPYAVNSYTGNAKTIRVPDTTNNGNIITEIGTDAFGYIDQVKGASLMDTVILPNSITIIKLGAFYLCTNLKSINLPTELITIERFAFRQCPFESIEIPSKVTFIGVSAFWESYNLKKVIMRPSTPPTLEDHSVFAALPAGWIMQVPATALSLYQSTYASFGINNVQSL